MTISLDNIRQFASEPDYDTVRQYFSNDDQLPLTNEHKDQILMLTGEASKYLWNFEHNVLAFEATEKFFKNVTHFDSTNKSDSEVRKYLYSIGIGFDHWVFIADQPHLGFILTWKMVVKYFNGLFFDDYQQIWDNTLNWKLEYNHGQFAFGKDLIYNSASESARIAKSVSEMIDRNKRNGV